MRGAVCLRICLFGKSHKAFRKLAASIHPARAAETRERDTLGAFLRHVRRHGNMVAFMANAAALKGMSATWRNKTRASIRHRKLQTEAMTAVLEVKTAEEAAKLAYHCQGNASLNTKEAFAQRQTVRRHPLVMQELDKWWGNALKLQARQRGPLGGSLSQDSYLTIYRLMSYDLLGDEEYIEADADAEALEEWEKDGIKGKRMERDQFMNTIFEVCDVYSTSPPSCSDLQSSLQDPPSTESHG